MLGKTNKMLVLITFLIPLIIVFDGCRNGFNQRVSYYPNGVKESIQHFDKNDSLSDTSFFYFDSSQLKKYIVYDKGERNGNSIEFFKNGKCKQEELYNHGVLEKAISFDSIGQTVSSYLHLNKSAMDSIHINVICDTAKSLFQNKIPIVIKSNVPIGNLIVSAPNTTIIKGKEIGHYYVKSRMNRDSVKLYFLVEIDNSFVQYPSPERIHCK